MPLFGFRNAKLVKPIEAESPNARACGEGIRLGMEGRQPRKRSRGLKRARAMISRKATDAVDLVSSAHSAAQTVQRPKKKSLNYPPRAALGERKCVGMPPPSKTALHIAIQRGEVDMATRLLAAGAPVNTRDSSGSTPLEHAAALGSEGLVSALLARKANARAGGASLTPLRAAIASGHAGVVRQLVSAGASIDMDREPKSGDTALHAAARSGRAGLVGLLLDAHASLDVRNKHGKTPLDVAKGPAKTRMLLVQRAQARSATPPLTYDGPATPPIPTPPRTPPGPSLVRPKPERWSKSDSAAEHRPKAEKTICESEDGKEVGNRGVGERNADQRRRSTGVS